MSDGRDDDGIKIFVYGVRASCPRDLIKTEFSKSGRVTDVFNTGKGYAFVTMEDERDAKMAVEDLNGSSIDGQEVKVEISHGKGTTKGGGGGGRGRDRYDRGGDRGYGRDRDRGGDRGYGGGGRDRFGGGGRDGRRYVTPFNLTTFFIIITPLSVIFFPDDFTLDDPSFFSLVL